MPGCARVFQRVSLSARQSAGDGKRRGKPVCASTCRSLLRTRAALERGASSGGSSGGLVAKKHSLLSFKFIGLSES